MTTIPQFPDAVNAFLDAIDADAIDADAGLPTWLLSWRRGIAPQLSTLELVALRSALVTDDPRLLQGKLCEPPPLQCFMDCPITHADPMTLAKWWSSQSGAMTVAEADEQFTAMANEADRLCGEPAAIRWFLNRWDDLPRDQAIAALLAEVERELTERGRLHEPTAAA